MYCIRKNIGELDLERSDDTFLFLIEMLSSSVDGEGIHSNSFPSGDNIKVYVRIRPFVDRERDLDPQQQCILSCDENRVVLRGAGRNGVFSFDHVGDETVQQEEVFRDVGKVIADTCLQGYNGTIFAYGQTGSGKTFTMQGPGVINRDDNEFNSRGLIPRCFEYLFATMAREQEKSPGKLHFLCRASYCEIYNEFVYDLLDPASPSCTIREDFKRGVYVDGITEETVISAEEALMVLRDGSQNRHVAATSMNRESSRSHAIFTLVIQSRVQDGDVTDMREGRFNLVDLAGSERQKLAATTGVRLKEAGSINRSLLALGNVINALVDKANGRPRHVHYRDSKLTFLLRDSLGGNAKTFLIANISPAQICFAESLSTLRFAQRAKLIRNQAVVNQEYHGNIIQLKEEIRRLKLELQLARRQVSGCDEGMLQYSLVSDERHLRTLVHSLLLRDKQAKETNDYTRKQLQLLQTLVGQQKQQLQSERMVLKFRESTIQALRRGNVNDDLDDEEKKLLVAENLRLKQQMAQNPDVTRFAAENLELRSMIREYGMKQNAVESENELVDALRTEVLALSEEVKGRPSVPPNDHEGASAAAENRLSDISVIQDSTKTNEEISKLESEIILLENKAENLTGKLEVVTELYQAAKVELEDISTERDYFKSKEQEAQSRINIILSEKKVLQKDIAQHMARSDQLVLENDDLKLLLANKDVESQQLISVMNQNTLLIHGKSEAEAFRIALSTDNDSLNQKITCLEKYINQLKEDLKEEKGVLSALHRNYSELRQENARFLKELEEKESLKSELLSMADIMKSQELKESSLSMSLEEKTALLNNLADRFDIVLSHIKGLCKLLEIDLPHGVLEVANLEAVLTKIKQCSQQTRAVLDLAQEDNQMLCERVSSLESSSSLTLGDKHEKSKCFTEDITQMTATLKEKEYQLHLEQERIRSMTEKLSCFDDIQGQQRDLEQLLDAVITRNETLEQENARLMKHNNVKQKLQYHLQIKQENNDLRYENQRLHAELDKLRNAKEKERSGRRMSIGQS